MWSPPHKSSTFLLYSHCSSHCSTCTSGCLDSEGNHHDLGDTWPDLHDPCQIWICTPNGPVRRPIKECDPLPPQPHPRCTVVVEDCCRTWSCPGCVDNNGIPREEGSRWEDPSDPCILYMCINGRIQSFPKTVFEPCPSPGPKPHDRCVYALIDCCHQWNCTNGCVDAYGQQHNVGDVWTDPIDRCFILTCTSTGIQRSPVSCPPLEPVLAVLTIKDITMLVTRGLIHMTTATVIPATTLALRGIQSPVQPLVPDLITLAPWSLMDAAGIGCCYNASSYRLGSVVAELPECCTNLVCGAKLTNAQPFFTTTIAQIIYEPHSGQYCGTPNFRYCMEQNGIIRMEGSEWYVTPCRKCGCERGVVDCTNVSPVCPPAPEPHCIAIPGSCCPTWDCRVQTGCIDERGTHRALGDTWPDPRDPCNIWVCTRNGPVNMPLKQCHPLPLPPNSDCRVVVVDCCNTWDCSTGGCTDGSGHHEIGDKWLDPTDPCTILTCTHSGIQKSNVKCPPIPPPPQEGCQMVKEQCCYVWRCSGCVDQNGVPHEEGSMWEDPRDPCTIHVCMNGQIETFQKSVIEPCPRPGPKPHEGCVYALVDCCHQWNCTTSGCNDRYGNPRDIGEVWPDLADSCYSFHCTPTGIERQRTICPKISSPPHTSCTLDLIGCCYNWTCPTSRCTDAYGQNHNLGDVWPDPTDSCYTFTCTSTGIERSRVTCPPLGPEPHASCTLQHQGCCYNWTCQTSGCNDRYGNPRDIGEVWPDLADSCYSFHCTPTGIERQRTICPKISSPPHTSCTLDLIGCCYNWTCPTSRCTDAYGQNHNLGDVWPDPTDSCYTFTCTSTGIERSRVTCPPLDLAQIRTALVVSAYNIKTNVTRRANVHLGTIAVLLLAVARNVYQKLNLAAAPRPILMSTLSVSPLSTPVKETKTALEERSAVLLSVARNVGTLFIEHVQQQYVNCHSNTPVNH
ncbi:hypothetical protein Pmani_022392 [Petrolisthes manimaculis]|uniref:VWFC domain-containing protein n=1 Tax=Petrolisthes manimaculis TaxID=1843537 RepID=A0AAE1U0P7_9EUCA|nr:hypothetical protein Pmani_022392 [Petrolisthes manimaculis]